MEDPQIYILGRSTSSLSDQAKFTESRIISEIKTQSGISIADVMRFFHGDGPTMQFEAGNKICGYYCCIGCDAHSTRFNEQREGVLEFCDLLTQLCTCSQQHQI